MPVLSANASFISVRSSDTRIINLDAITYAGNLDPIPKPCDQHVFVKGDIRDGELVSRLLREYQVDAVINFASESHVDRSIDGPGAFIDTIINGTFHLLNASLAYWGILRYLVFWEKPAKSSKSPGVMCRHVAFTPI